MKLATNRTVRSKEVTTDCTWDKFKKKRQREENIQLKKLAAVIPRDYLHEGMGPWLVNAQCTRPRATLKNTAYKKSTYHIGDGGLLKIKTQP